MKTLKTLLLIVAITFGTSAFAGTAPKTADPSSLSKEIAKLLKNPKITIEQDIEALVTITFNKYNEIVVLSVDSENTELKNFIKSRLNYNKVKASLDSEYSNYIVPVRLTKE